MIKYFAYGSNMYTARLIKRKIHSKKIDNGKLVGYKLKFNKRSIDKSAKATIFKTCKSQDVVLGVIFEISELDLPKLDNAEGVGYGYNKEWINVIDNKNNKHNVLVYIADESYIDNSLFPYLWYMKYIIEGAKEHNLPLEYIDELKGINSIEDKDAARRNIELANFKT